MSIHWITDPHFDHLDSKGLLDGYGASIEADIVLITGDIGQANTVERLLSRFAGEYHGEILFVLGNHDYYYGSFRETTEDVRRTFAGTNASFLDFDEPALLSDEVAVTGHSGWYDAEWGDPYGSRVIMTDFQIIRELRQRFPRFDWVDSRFPEARKQMIEYLRSHARALAEIARRNLEAALELRKDVIFLTHASPYEETSTHMGKMSNDDWMPWFSSKAMGDMLDEVAAAHPDNRILVLCGHSHSPAKLLRASNLKVMCGRARYGKRITAGIFDLPLEDGLWQA